MKRNMGSDRVLTIASHVVSGYVGNSVTTFVLQLLGLDTASLNTVQFSNHAGYRCLEGYQTSAEQITALYDGLRKNGLDDFGMLLTGYVPSQECVQAVEKVARDFKARGGFWLLDPVMGDQGRLYVNKDVLPVYKSIIHLADLIVPNQFEAELLSGIKVDSLSSLSLAIDQLHRNYMTPHVVITSVTFAGGTQKMLCVGSSMTSSAKPRKFVFDVEMIDGFFSGTGDMFAALTLARFRQEAEADGVLACAGWRSPDHVPPLRLPLARAIGRVLGSMHLVLVKTREARDRELALCSDSCEGGDAQASHVRLTKASELRLVRCQRELQNPEVVYQAVELE